MTESDPFQPTSINDGVVFVGKEVERHGLAQLVIDDERDVLELLQLFLGVVADLSLDDVLAFVQLASVLMRISVAGSDQTLLFVEQHPQLRLELRLVQHVAQEAQVGRHLGGR